MFRHNFKYTLKTLFKNKMLIFWTFIFPIILGTFFNMAFANIENTEKFDVIDIAVVKNNEFNNNTVFKESFRHLGDKKNRDRIFNIKYVTEKQTEKLLTDDKIVGYLKLEDKPKVVVKSSGTSETILKYVTEEISQMQQIMMDTIDAKLKQNDISTSQDLNFLYASVYKDALKLSEQKTTNIKNISSNNLSYTMIEFYTLIAMACLYGGILGMVAINQCLANMSSNGKRVAISPVSKSKLVLSSAFASYIIQLIGIFLLFVYTIFVLKVDYGNNLALVILLSLVGSFAGLSLGIFVASIFKGNDNLKTGIIISVTMLGCFLSGMMGITMKYIIDKNIPIINRLNPANMITDGFYSLYYYDTLDRFFFNVVSLLIFASIMIVISMFSLRRQTYDSI